YSIQQDGSRCHIIKTWNERANSRFPRTRWTDQSYIFSRLNMKRQMIQHMVQMRFIPEGNVPELNFTTHLIHLHGIRFVFDLRLDIQNFHEALESGNSLLKLGT